MIAVLTKKLTKLHQLVSSKLQPYNGLLHKLELLLNLVLAILYLTVWINPQLFSIEFIYAMSAFIAFEFVVLHSGVFMSLFVPYSILLFFPFYFLLLSSMISDLSYLILYLLVVIFRMKDSFLGTKQESAGKTIARSWYFFFHLFFPLILFIVLISTLIPQLGLSDLFLNSSGYYPQYEKGRDTEVHHLICFGFLYYLLSIRLSIQLFRRFEHSLKIMIISSSELLLPLMSKKLRKEGHVVFWSLINSNQELEPSTEFTKWMENNKRFKKENSDASNNLDLIILGEGFTAADKSTNDQLASNMDEVIIFDIRNELLAKADKEQFYKWGNRLHKKVAFISNELTIEQLVNPPFFYKEERVDITTNDPDTKDTIRYLLKRWGWKKDQIHMS